MGCIFLLLHSPLSSVNCAYVCVRCVCVCALDKCVSSCMSVHDGDVSAAPSYVIRVTAAVLVWLQELKATAVLCCSSRSGCITFLSLSVPSLPFPVLFQLGSEEGSAMIWFNHQILLTCATLGWWFSSLESVKRELLNLKLWGSAFCNTGFVHLYKYWHIPLVDFLFHLPQGH